MYISKTETQRNAVKNLESQDLGGDKEWMYMSHSKHFEPCHLTSLTIGYDNHEDLNQGVYILNKRHVSQTP